MEKLFIPEWEYNFWFYPDPTQENNYVVSYIKSGDFYCYCQEDGFSSLTDLDKRNTVTAAFKMYKMRPEYKLHQYISKGMYCPSVPQSNDLDFMRTDYDNCLAGAILLRYLQLYKDPNVGIKRVNAMFDWLEGNKFYEAPASSRFHECYKGGLLHHSIKVFNQMCQLRNLQSFKDISPESIGIASLPHDWCKIGLYHTYMKNVKNEQTGQWEQQEAYRRELTGIPMGHGEASLYYIQKFVSLTDEEALAIRWHMGAWNICDGETDEFQAANERYPLVHMLQFADQLSITEYTK